MGIDATAAIVINDEAESGTESDRAKYRNRRSR
jgi:hypothetical protein